jgi:site-specific recombinase XerD
MKILKIFQEKLRYKNYSYKSINLYTLYLKNFLETMNVKDPYQIRTQEIISFLENHKYTSISQQNQYIGSLKLFAKYILNKKDIHLSKIERPKKEKKLPKVIDGEFIKNQLTKITNLKHKTILTLTYSVGLRVSEVVNLKIEDIDSKRMLINIRQAKGRKDRIVPLSKNVLKLLREYYIQYRPKEYMFNGQTSQKYSVGSCQKIFKKYIDDGMSFHSLRHSCFTNLLENGTDLRIIQKIAGHSSSKTTEIYTHVSTQLLNQVQTPI